MNLATWVPIEEFIPEELSEQYFYIVSGFTEEKGGEDPKRWAINADYFDNVWFDPDGMALLPPTHFMIVSLP
jgi:hypothetical protein